MTVITFDKEQFKRIKNMVALRGGGKGTAKFVDGVQIEVTDYNFVRISTINLIHDAFVSEFKPVTLTDVNIKSIIVPNEMFKSAQLSKSDTSTYVISFDDDKQATLKTPNSEGNYKALDTEFPKFPSVDEFETVMSIRSNTLDKLLAANLSTATSESRPVLTTVQVKNDVIVSTDSHRLFKSKSKAQINEGEVKIPNTLLKYIQKLEDKKKLFGVLKSDGHSRLLFETLDTLYFVCTKEGNYPETERLIPEDFVIEAEIVDIKDFAEGVKLATKVVKDDKNYPVRMKFSDKEVTLTATDKDADGSILAEFNRSYAINVKHCKEKNFEILCSGKYLTEGITQVNSNKPLFSFTGKFRPFIISGKETDNISLILPVRTY